MTAQLLSDGLEVGIVTRNMEAMRHFYGEVLGLQYSEWLEFPGGGMHRYRIGDSIVKLVSLDPPPAGTNPPGGGSAATGLRYVSLAVGNLAEVVAAVRQAGCEVQVEITPFGEGLAWAFVCDPDGNWVEMFGPAEPA